MRYDDNMVDTYPGEPPDAAPQRLFGGDVLPGYVVADDGIYRCPCGLICDLPLSHETRSRVFELDPLCNARDCRIAR